MFAVESEFNKIMESGGLQGDRARAFLHRIRYELEADKMDVEMRTYSLGYWVTMFSQLTAHTTYEWEEEKAIYRFWSDYLATMYPRDLYVSHGVYRIQRIFRKLSKSEEYPDLSARITKAEGKDWQNIYNVVMHKEYSRIYRYLTLLRRDVVMEDLS